MTVRWYRDEAGSPHFYVPEEDGDRAHDDAVELLSTEQACGHVKCSVVLGLREVAHSRDMGAIGTYARLCGEEPWKADVFQIALPNGGYGAIICVRWRDGATGNSVWEDFEACVKWATDSPHLAEAYVHIQRLGGSCEKVQGAGQHCADPDRPRESGGWDGSCGGCEVCGSRSLDSPENAGEEQGGG
jgi:hypothetical protein